MTVDSTLYLALLPFAFVVAFLPLIKSRDRRTTSICSLRALAMTSIIIGLTRPHTMEEKPAETVPVLVDISASMSEDQGERLLSRARILADSLHAPLQIIPFGRAVASQPVASAPRSFRSLQNEYEGLDLGSTNLENALRSLQSTHGSESSRPPALLLSDGYETEGSSLEALNVGIASRVFPLTEGGTRDTGDVEIAQLYAPLTAKTQRSVDIRTTLANHRDAPLVARLTLQHGERDILARDITLAPDSEETLVTPSDPSLEGLNRITATLRWRESDGEHSVSKTTWLAGEKRQKVLLISTSDEDARYLTDILKSQAYQLRSHISGRDTPISPSELSQFTAVILNNVARQQLPAEIVSAIPSYAHQGGGVIMVGGPQSFGLGGYMQSPLEGILPVKLLPPRTEKKRLTVAIELVIDKSQSMGHDQKLDFAKIAAHRVIASLKDDDLLGVVGFDIEAFRLIPLLPVKVVRPIADERIGKLVNNENTFLLKALREAENSLARATAGRKHAIVITDGKLPDAITNGESYAQLVRRMHTLGITVSTVLVGADDDTGLLKDLAIIGGGSHYRTMNAADIPSIFLSDISIASGERSLRESTDTPIYRGPQGIHSTTLNGFPPLKGFVETLPRDDATTELIVSDGEKTYPLLASRKHGSGTVIAFTSDANGRWSAPWMRWQSIHQFWSDLVDAVRSPVTSGPKQNQFDLRHWIEGGEQGIELALFNDPGGKPVTARVITPMGEKVTIPCIQQAIGRYRGTISKPSAGTYRVTFSIGDEELPEVAWYLSGEMFGEKPHAQPDMTTLQQIAARTGGSVNPELATLQRALTLKEEKQDYSLLLFALALMLFAAEVTVRQGREG